MFAKWFLLIAAGLLTTLSAGCSSDAGGTGLPADGDADSDTDTSSDTDADSDTDSDADSDTDSDADGDTDSCGGELQILVRDFKASHEDFEELFPDADGDDDGPEKSCEGFVEDTLGTDGKPVFVTGTCDEDRSGDILTYTHIKSAASFADWYNDVPGVNMPIETSIALTDMGDGTFVFDDATFFPLSLTDGFGAEPNQLDINGNPENFLFTTEAHTRFKYEGGETFTFRGDDDLWLFIDGKLAIDIGGLHLAEERSVNLDDLGLTAGETYTMDIFHAERKTTDSNFRVETTIQCFEIIID